MDLPDADLATLLFKLIPGLIAATAFHSLTPHPRRDLFDRVTNALIFTVIAEIIVDGLARPLCIFIGDHIVSVGYWNATAQLGWMALVGLASGILIAWLTNTGKLHDWARNLKVTRQTSSPTQWNSAFAANALFVVLHLRNGRHLMGWPREWPDTPDAGHFRIELPAWLLKSGERARMLHVKEMLVSVQDVELVEFLFNKSDQVNTDHASEIKSTREVMTKLNQEDDHCQKKKDEKKRV